MNSHSLRTEILSGSSAPLPDIVCCSNTLRWTKSSSLQGIDDSSAAAALGREGEDFEFSHLRQPVEFVEGSCGANEDDEPSLEAVTDWLNMLA